MTEYLGPPMPEDEFDDRDYISEEDVFEKIEESLKQEQKVEIQVPSGDLSSIKQFLYSYNVVGVEGATNEQLEDIWYRLTKDHSIGPEYSHMPGIYSGVLKDFAYLLTDFNTKLAISSLPMPVRIEDFVRHAKELESRKFSPRMWIIEHEAVPNLSNLGMDQFEVFNSADSDKEGTIRLAQVTRFLGWLVSQEFLKHEMPDRLSDFMKENKHDEVTLTSIGAAAFIGVMDKLKELEKRRGVYEHGYPVDHASVERYQDVVHAMKGIRRWADTLVLGEPQQH